MQPLLEKVQHQHLPGKLKAPFCYLKEATIMYVCTDVVLRSTAWHLLTPQASFPLPVPVSHFHVPFQGSRGREKTNKQGLSPEFMFSKGDWGEGQREGLWLAIEHCCPYPERCVYAAR